MVTIKEIARQAGVSTTTVSNVLHKKNARVSAETIEKVERLLAENNYIPRLGLNALTNRSSRIICILITTPEFARGSAYETPFYGNMLGHLEHLLRERGKPLYRVLGGFRAEKHLRGVWPGHSGARGGRESGRDLRQHSGPEL